MPYSLQDEDCQFLTAKFAHPTLVLNQKVADAFVGLEVKTVKGEIVGKCIDAVFIPDEGHVQYTMRIVKGTKVRFGVYFQA